MSKTLKIIFTLSVILNIVLIGVGAGMAHKLVRKLPPHITELRGELSPEARDIMRAQFKEGKGEFLSMMKEGKEKRDAITKVLKAEEFDEAAYDAAVQDMLEMQARMEARKAERMKDMFQQLAPEDRKKMAESYSSRMSHKGHFRDEKRKEFKGQVPE